MREQIHNMHAITEHRNSLMARNGYPSLRLEASMGTKITYALLKLASLSSVRSKSVQYLFGRDGLIADSILAGLATFFKLAHLELERSFEIQCSVFLV